MRKNPTKTSSPPPRFDLYAEEKLLLKDASFFLARGDKCALVGDNGTGKTTLLKFLKTESAKVQFGKFVRVAYYDQENADLDPEEEVLSAFWGKYARLSQTEARALLARAGLVAEDMTKKVKELSGGQRAKLSLALLEGRRGNVLLLDEPTNHLDLPARESLEEALKAFDGTLLFVSHDRRFIESVAGRIALIEDGKLTFFTGSYEAFLESRKKEPAPERAEKKEERSGSYRSKGERARETRTKVRVKEIETRLEALEQEEERLNEELAQNAADYKKVLSLTEALDKLRSETDALYSEYETLI